MDVKSYKAKTPIKNGNTEILACQTFDDPPEGEWVACDGEDIVGLEALMLRKGALMLGKI